MLLTVGRSNGISALQLKDQFGPGLQSRVASAAEAPPGDAGRGRDRRGDSGNRDQSRRLALLRGFSELAAAGGRRPSGAQGSGMDPLHVFKPRVPGHGVLQAFRPPSRRTGVPVEPAQPRQGKLWCAAPRRLASGSGTHALDAGSGSGGCRAGGAAAVVFEPGPGRGQPPPRLATPQTPSSRTSAAPKLPTIDRFWGPVLAATPSWRYQMPAASSRAGGP